MTTLQSINEEDFIEYLKVLQNYEKAGLRQCSSIIEILKCATLTSSQRKRLSPKDWLNFLQKIKSNSQEDSEFKNLAISLFDKLESDSTGQKKKSKNSSEEVTSEKENQPNKQNKESESQNIITKRINHLETDKETKSNLDPMIRDYTLKAFSEELISDYKSSEGAKEKLMPLAKRKASELEKAIESEVNSDENQFCMEARNVSNYLQTKSNEGLRKGLLSGDIDAKDFIENKEDYLSNQLKSVIQEKEKEEYNAVSLDRDIAIIQDNPLYQCDKCASRKIIATEKQMKDGTQPSTTVLACAECEFVKLIEA